jgi:Tol biopolymer transport system component
MPPLRRRDQKNMTWTKIAAILNISALFFWGSSTLAAEQLKLAFVRGGNIWIADSGGRGARQLTYSHQDRGPALSPDGKWVAYYSGAGEATGFGQIFLIPSRGGMIQQFRQPQIQGGEHPVFSPDGQGLLFVGLSDLEISQRRGSEQTYATMSLSLAELASGEVRKIISHPHTRLDAGYIYSNPAFSPDGRLIAFQESGSDVSGGFEVINLQGKRIWRFPRNPRDATPYWRPQFFPGGREMLCYTPATGPGKEDIIYRVHLASGKKTALTLGSNPTLVEHGQAVVYERWPQERWTAGATVKPNLWRLELKAGAIPHKIITDAGEPAGQMP